MAVGVRYLRGGRSHEVRAEREVILAAGVFNSPQILHRSGVGPPELLADIGAQVVHALPGVGENLRDHVFAPVVARVKGVETINEMSHGLRLAREVLKYVFTRRGLLALQVTLVYLSWHSDGSGEKHRYPDLFYPGELSNRCGLWSQRLSRDDRSRVAAPAPKVKVTFVPAPPIRLKAPIIQPNYLAERDRSSRALERGPS